MAAKRKKHSATIVGFAWYRKDQWDRLKAVSQDWASLEVTWKEWCDNAEETLRRMTTEGFVVKKVDVDVETLVQWCEAKHLPVNAASRSEYTSEKLRAEAAR